MLVTTEPVIEREEVLALLSVLFDIRRELSEIRIILEGEDEQEEED
jgi:hypothetical protein